MKGLITLLLVQLALVSSAQFFIPNQTVSATTNPGTGNVGIGNSTPTFKLDVTGNLRTTSFASFREYLTVDNGGSYRVALNAQSDGYITARNSIGEDKFTITTNGSSYFNGGNVGFGSTAPLGTVHVNTVRPIIMKNNGGNGVYGSEIGFNATLNTAVVPNLFTKLGGTSQAGGASIVVDHSGNMLFQMFDGGTLDQVNTNFNPQIVFKNDGKVGLGTPTPLAILDIRKGSSDPITGAAAIRIAGKDNYPSLELGIKGDYDGMISTFGNDLHLYAGNWRSASATATENHNISFYTSQVGSNNWNTPKMILRYDGNVGIGTPNPDAKLAVKGTIHAEEVKVDLSVPGPDYVFEPDYNLPTLTEIETYIKANKHLPEVPSAKEMETNGINLSEMNMLLLKKVEELTLHMIELKKENEKQNEVIKTLQQK